MSKAAEANRRYYERTTAGRDEYWRKMAAPRHRVAVTLGLLERARPHSVVDLGCGNGVLLEAVRAALPGAVLAGIDLSASQVTLNRVERPWARWETMDLASPGVVADALTGSFDAVLACEVLEHLDAPGVFLENARRLATAQATLVVTTQSGTVRETERRVGHRRHFDADTMRGLLARHGWEPIRVWNTGWPFHDLSKWYANLDPDASMRRFGEGAYGWREDLVCAALRLAFRVNSRHRGAQLFAVARAR